MKSKYTKLFLSLLLDAVGMISYFFPGIGETIDVVWAPLSSIIIAKLYQNKISKVTSVINFLEEALPFADILPTATITWFLSYWFDKKEQKNTSQSVKTNV